LLAPDSYELNGQLFEVPLKAIWHDQLKILEGRLFASTRLPQGATTRDTGVDNELIIEPIFVIVTSNQNFPANPSISAPYGEAGLTSANSVGNR
jgi:hypothetical protein